MTFAMDIKIADKGLFKRLDKAIDLFGQDVIKGVGYRTGQAIRYFAPKSGISHEGKKLAQSIVTIPQGKYTFSIIVGKGLYRPYHIYQEMGYVPHWVSKRLHPEVEAIGKGKKAVFVKKYTPYIAPALQNVDEYIRREVDAQFNRHMRK